MLDKAASSLTAGPPRLLRRWLRGSLLGAGSFGRVSLALNLDDGFLFAVKSAPCFRSAQLLSLQNELSILQSLNSPHIIRCFGADISITDNSPCLNLFLEYMQGGSIADMVKKSGGRLDERYTRQYTRSILEGLSYLHKQGVVHGDIKGQNILLGACGEIKIADFGAARVAESVPSGNCRDFSMRGTPLWMAPEVLRGVEPSSASDIWSLGCTLVEMMQGRPPWGRSSKEYTSTDDLASLLFKIAYTQESAPLIDSFLSADAKDFLSKCLQRDPNQRWTADQLLSHPFVVMKEGGMYGNQTSPRSILSFHEERDVYLESESESESVAMSHLTSHLMSASSDRLACKSLERVVDRYCDERQRGNVVLHERVVVEEPGLTWITVRRSKDLSSQTQTQKPFFRAVEVEVRKGSDINLNLSGFLADRARAVERRR